MCIRDSIKSILAKYAAKEERLPDGQPIRGAEGGSEKALELALTKFNETIDAAFAELAPHKICQYIYELSDMFNQFYRDNIILGETCLLYTSHYPRQLPGKSGRLQIKTCISCACGVK